MVSCLWQLRFSYRCLTPEFLHLSSYLVYSIGRKVPVPNPFSHSQLKRERKKFRLRSLDPTSPTYIYKVTSSLSLKYDRVLIFDFYLLTLKLLVFGDSLKTLDGFCPKLWKKSPISLNCIMVPVTKLFLFCYCTKMRRFDSVKLFGESIVDFLFILVLI